MKFKLAILQYEVITADKEANFAKVRELFAAARAAGADAVLLPELFNCGYECDMKEQSETAKGKTVNFISKLCAKYGLAMLGGSFIESKSGSLYNTSLVIDANGTVMAKYRKVHLFAEAGEAEYMAPGEEWCLYDYQDTIFGIFTCYDLRFPAFIQNLSLRGAKILSTCAQWPAARTMHWWTLLRARAIENETWVLACNSVGGAHHSGGHSLIIAPDGTIIAEAGEAEELLIADIDTETHLGKGVLANRRAILDEIDESQI